MRKEYNLLDQITDLVGTEIALKIATACGGTRVSIPAKATEDHWLTELVGMAIASKICEGLAILISDTDTDRGKLRGVVDEMLQLGPATIINLAMLKAEQIISEGGSARDASRGTGLHERTIWRIRARMTRKALALLAQGLTNSQVSASSGLPPSDIRRLRGKISNEGKR